MSNEKPKSSAADSKKVFDVAKPGKSSPDATSKPIIITNRPVLKDPMMTDEPSGPPPVDENVAPSNPSIRIKISPLGDESEVPAEPLVRDSIEDKPQEAPVEDKPEAAVEPDAEPAVEESKEPEPVAESEAVVAEVAEPSKESVEPGKPAPSAPAAPAATEEATAEENSEADSDQPNAQRADQNEDEEALRKEIERQTELQKIIESKKYYLPINAVSKRRSKRHIIIGALLILVLALVWADIALDSGMITIKGIKPFTHFFGSSSVVAATSSTPTTQLTSQYTTYTSPADGATFVYPKNWVFSNKPQGGSEFVSLEPSIAALNGQDGLFTINFVRNKGDGVGSTTTHPSFQTTSNTYTVVDVSYQQLPNSPASAPLYLQQFIVESKNTGSDRYILYLNISPTKALQVGETITGPNDVMSSQSFIINNEHDSLNFGGVLSFKDSDGREGMQTLSAAQDLLKNNSVVKQASAILLSFKAAK